MPTSATLVFAAALLLCGSADAWGQDLAPRAYVITAEHSNAITLTYAYYTGNVLFGGAVPITGAVAHINVPTFTYYHSLNFFGRSANIVASLPYGVGNFKGTVIDTPEHLYRSGLLDSVYRFSVNLKGGPAMSPQEFQKWRQKILIGASVKIVAPSGQYDSTKLINWGNNRWAFKPEIGYSERWGHWILDGYAGIWFYTRNPASFDGPIVAPQTQAPIGSFEGHLSYEFKPRLWISLDGNFWAGGVTSLSGVQNLQTKQTASRIGVTAAIPLNKHQSIKASYSDGTYVRFGGDYQSVSVAWQYSWIGQPK